MKKIFSLLIFTTAFVMSVSHITETYNDGMPKVIKEYNTASKLYLSKETGYYPDGVKMYENKYYKGKQTSSYKWDQNGKRVVEDINASDWSEFQKNELVIDCVEGGAPSKKVCECVVDAIVEIFTYSEFKSMEVKSQQELTQEEQKKAELIFESAIKCSE